MKRLNYEEFIAIEAKAAHRIFGSLTELKQSNPDFADAIAAYLGVITEEIFGGMKETDTVEFEEA